MPAPKSGSAAISAYKLAESKYWSAPPSSASKPASAPPRPSQAALPTVLISLQSPSTGVLRPAVLLSQRVLPAVLKHPASSAVLISLLTITV